MYERIEFHVRGTLPLMMHNQQLANPRNKWAKALKQLSGKRKKTDDDLDEMAHVEFMGGLYLGKSGEPIIPGVGIEAALLQAAKTRRQGPLIKKATRSPGDWPVIYDGPKDAEGLWETGPFDSGGHVHTCLVRVESSRVLRTRPVFPEWECRFVIEYLPDLINARDLVTLVEVMGREVGLYEYRPKFGTFEILSHKAVKAAA